MQDKVRVSIIGAGIAGPVLALSILTNPFLKAKFQPVVYDKLPAPNDLSSSSSDQRGRSSYAAGAAVALTSNALYPLYQLGLKDDLHKVSSETKIINIWRSWDNKDSVEKEQPWPHKWLNNIKNPNWNAEFETNLRVVERRDLQGILLDHFQGLGGEIVWNKKLRAIERQHKRGLQLLFEDESVYETDLLVGADGNWSSVRKWIMTQVAPESSELWKPDFPFCSGIYGIAERFGNLDQDAQPGDTHWIMLDQGMASTWSLPNGKLFWTISLPEDKPPERSNADNTRESIQLYGADVTCGGYSLESTKAILARHESIWHPLGTFGDIFRHSDRIVRAPLWHKAWDVNEIGNDNAVVIGDASRAMLPSSGQGACFGIEDATVLANALLNHASKYDASPLYLRSAISDYASSRVPRSKRMASQSYWTSVVGLAQSWWWRWIRDYGTAWMPLGGDPKT